MKRLIALILVCALLVGCTPQVDNDGAEPTTSTTETQQTVTGKVRLKLYKGNIINSGVWSPYSLYSEDIVTFNEGEGYQQSDATGFIRLLGLPTRIQASVNARNRREAEKC